MIRYFLKVFSNHFRQGRTLFLLSVFGVALGVASVLSIQIINHNAIGAFSAGIEAVSGEADLSVLSSTHTFSENLYPEVLSLAGVSAAWPLYRIDVSLADRKNFFLEIIGVDFLTTTLLPWSDSEEDFSKVLFHPWVAVNPSLAQEMGWSVGDSITVSSGSQKADLTIGALVDFQKISPLASRKLAVMDIGQIQALLGVRGQIHQVDIQLQEGVDRGEAARQLRTKLGPSVRVVTPQQREQQAANLMNAFRLNLTALSLISLFVGVFLVHTTTQAGLVRRRSEFGLLRSLGATRGQVLGIILAEVITLGLLGVLLGLPLGYWVAQANVDMVSSTLTNLYLLDEIESLQIPSWFFALAIAIGIGAAAAGALLPALDMSRRDTKSLMTAFTLHEKAHTLAAPLFTAGCSIVAMTGIWFWLMGGTWKPAGFALAVVLLIAFPLLTPLLVKKVCERIKSGGFGFRYSLKSLVIRLQTTSFAVACLGIAVSMLVGITLMIGSFRKTVEVWVDTTVRADVYITTESWRAEPGATLDNALVSDLSTHPGVISVDRLRRLLLWTDNTRISIGGVDIRPIDNDQSRFPLLKGDRRQVLNRVRKEGAVLISEPLARKSGLDVGHQLKMNGPHGVVQFPIAGIYYDYSSELGSATMDLSTMNAHFGTGPINSLSLYLERGRDPEKVVNEIQSRFSDRPLRVRSNRHLREEIFTIFDQTFAVVRILQAMSLLIAVCGITLTLLVLARERVSELALYRALGASRAQIFRVFMGKGLAMGILGLAMGILGGIILAAILIFVINRTYFGWTIQVYWPGWSILKQVVTILGAALVASLYPALRASKVPATELSRDDI